MEFSLKPGIFSEEDVEFSPKTWNFLVVTTWDFPFSTCNPDANANPIRGSWPWVGGCVGG